MEKFRHNSDENGERKTMLEKTYIKNGRKCRVTFYLPAEVNVNEVSLCGDFNGWSSSVHPMRKLKGGRFSTTISLEAGHNYRFKYFVEGHRWENDSNADGYVENDFGTEDSLVIV